MIKRFTDIAGSLTGLILLSPILLMITLLVRIYNGKPVIFSQMRPGYKGEPFMFYKFRTMSNERDENGDLLPDEKRLTGFGSFLRKLSLDELPSLFNVLNGDMSLVGPRPLLMDYLPLYSDFQMLRHEVKPGITGWAQINGRNNLEWEDKFEMDVWYVQNQSLWLDLKILILTIYKVIKREGISAEGEATMTAFKGNDH